MATLDRKLPSPDAFLCKPWSTFIDAAKLHCSDNVDLEETGKEVGKGREVMRLNKEDMHLFGHYPAHDEFFLVVCNICNQVVKPQVFQTHCGLMSHLLPRERRHGSVFKPSPSPASSPCNSRSSLAQMKPKVCVTHNSVNSNSKPFRMPKDNLHTSINKQQHTVFASKVPRDKPCVPVPVVSLEKIPNLVKADGANVKMNSTTTSTTTSSASSSTTSSAALVKPALTSTASKPVPPSQEKILNGKGLISPSSLDKKHQNGTKSSNKPYKRLSEREFDPNKHCGVLDPETKKPCTRSLTCKTHSLTHRRAVPGRKKQFDILLAEHKARAREKEGVKDRDHPGIREPNHSHPLLLQDPVAGTLASPGFESKTASPAKSRLSNANFSRPSLGSSGGGLCSLTDGGAGTEPPAPAPGGDVGGRLSSDEGEAEAPEDSEKLDCHFSGHHPRPQGFCTFGSRLMGRGYYVFDRRWDRFRLALNSMVEKHLNSQMWKKIPPAADSPMPSPTPQLTAAFPVLQAFSSPSAVYLSSSGMSPSMAPSYVMSSPLLSPPAFASPSDSNSIMSYTAAFPHGTAAFSMMDSSFKSPSLVSPVPAIAPSPSHGKQARTKTSKSLKVRDISSRAISSSSGKKKKPPTSASPLQSSPVSSYPGSHKKNCVLAPGSTLNSCQTTSSYNNVSVHNSNNGTNPLSAKSEPSGRTALSSSSTDSIKNISMVVSSIDPSVSMSSHIHHSGDHALSAHNAMSSASLSFDRSEGKKRKNSSSISKSSKITKMPGMNSVHRKSTASLLSAVPESPNSSLSRQV
ncbi:AT7L1 protein, partial [Atractosteus spatula]|nr:AT7L1 protein [Atractosteus spatula]